MLAIRLQRRGRKGHAQFRVIVQDSRRSPSSGRVVAHLGNYDPHTKVATIDAEKAEFYLTNGAQPSDSAAKLLKREKVKLPEWVSFDADKKRSIKNIEKLRKNAPAEEPAPEAAEEPAAETEAEEATPPAADDAEAKADEPAAEEKPEEPAKEEPKDEAEEKPADDKKESEEKSE